MNTLKTSNFRIVGPRKAKDLKNGTQNIAKSPVFAGSYGDEIQPFAEKIRRKVARKRQKIQADHLRDYTNFLMTLHIIYVIIKGVSMRIKNGRL